MSHRETPSADNELASTKAGPATVVGVPKETLAGDLRAAASPESVTKLTQLGYEVRVQSGAGLGATFSDQDYERAGARIAPDAASVWSESDLILKVNKPSDAEVGLIREGGVLISFLRPAQNQALIDKLAAKRATAFAMDCVPRISRAQKMDALS